MSNLLYFEAATMKELHAAMVEWQSKALAEHQARFDAALKAREPLPVWCSQFSSFSISREGTRYCCIVNTEPTPVYLCDLNGIPLMVQSDFSGRFNPTPPTLAVIVEPSRY